MLPLHDFLRATPPDLLKEYFDQHAWVLPPLDWSMPQRKLAAVLLGAVNALEPNERQTVLDDADRISVMAGEDGEAALLSAVPDPGPLERMENAHARAAWVFLRDPRGWEQAEQIRYSDGRRFGRKWAGYAGPKDKMVARDEKSVADFERAVAVALRTGNVKAEICDRGRPTSATRKSRLVQVAVYLEGRPTSRRVFRDGALDRVPDLPVVEAAISYEPSTGGIEVVAATKDLREALLKIFADYLLGGMVSGQRLRLREFDLEPLLRQLEFSTEARHGIEGVDVTMLRLMPLDAQGERITLECLRGASRTIWQAAADRFGANNPLLGGHRATQARLRIRFAPRANGRGRRTLPITITMPHGCDLKEKTEQEHLIGETYLERWGLRRNV